MRTGLTDSLFQAILRERSLEARDLLFANLFDGRRHANVDPGELFLAFDQTFRSFDPARCNRTGNGGDVLACTFLKLVWARANELARVRRAEASMPLHVSRRRPDRFTRVSLAAIAELTQEDYDAGNL